MDNIFNVDNLSADNNVENIHNIFEARNTLLCLTWDPRADESWTSQCMAKSASAVENGRRNVRVNSIHPGLIDTNMLNDAVLEGQDNSEIVRRNVPLGRTATAEEVASLALFLASDDSSYVTGSSFLVDGGITAAYVTSEDQVDPFGGPEWMKK